MKIEHWSLINQYFQACFVEFNPSSLRSLLKDGVSFGFGELNDNNVVDNKFELRGIDDVMKYYENSYFNVADISSTNIIDLKIKESPHDPSKPYFFSICAEYTIEQTYIVGSVSQRYHAKVVEFFFPSKGGKISIINRTMKKRLVG